MDDHHGPPSLHTTLEETAQILPDTLQTEAHQRKWTKASETDLNDPPEAIASIPQLNPGEVTASCASEPVGLKNIEMRDGAEESLQSLETDADMSESAGRTGQSNSSAAAMSEAEVCPENIQLQTSGSDICCHISDNEMSSAADGVTPHSGCTKSSPVSQPVITPQGKAANYSFCIGIMRI